MPKIHDMDFDTYTYESVSIERTAIVDEFARVSSDIAYWGEKIAMCERALAEANMELAEVYAAQYTGHRNAMEAEGLKISETRVESRVFRTPAYRAAKQHAIDCKSEKQRVQQILEAVRAKREMLVSLGAHLRAEMKSEPNIRSDE